LQASQESPARRFIMRNERYARIAMAVQLSFKNEKGLEPAKHEDKRKWGRCLF